MGVAQDYIAAKQDAKQRADTTQYHLTRAYLAGISKLEDSQKKIDFSKLEEPTCEQEVIDTLYKTLIQYALATSNSQAKDEFTQQKMVQMVFGFTKKELADAIKTGQIRNYAEFSQTLSKNSKTMGYFKEQWERQYPIDQIAYSDEAREDVLDHVGITDKETRKNLARVLRGQEHLAQVIDIFQANGQIPPKTLEQLLKQAA